MLHKISQHSSAEYLMQNDKQTNTFNYVFNSRLFLSNSKIAHCNKAVLEPRVSPAFAITYFCNHYNIRFENTSKYVDILTLFQKLEPKVIDP